MASPKKNFNKMSKEEWEAHFEDRKKLAAYYEKRGYNSLVEISPQAYIIFINGVLWDVFREEELEGADKWMCRSSMINGDYLDPLPTLKACREAIAAMKAGSTTTETKVEAKEKAVVAATPKFPNYKLLRDVDVVISEIDVQEFGEPVNWTAGCTLLGRQILEVTEDHIKLQLDYGFAWVPASAAVLVSEYASKHLTELGKLPE